jgi:photosystem II stability/assembly factor-like uncharacterized protein
MSMHRRGLAIPIVFLLCLLARGSDAASTPAPPQWTPLPFYGGDVQVVAVPGSSTLVYVSTTTDGLYQSADGGTTWRFVAQGPNRFRTQILGVDPHDARRIYAVGYDPYSYRGFFRSDDGGRHWRRSDQGMATAFVLAVAFEPQASGWMYAATSTGLFRSRHGASWSRLAFSGQLVRAVAVAPGDVPVVLAAVTTGQQASVERSTDGGTSFVQVLDRAPSGFVFDPAHPGRVYGFDSVSVIRSDDLGAGWTSPRRAPMTLLTLAIAPSGALLAGGYENGVARSTDGGVTWSLPTGIGKVGSPPDVIASLAGVGNRVLAGGRRGVWQAGADGRGWRAASQGIRAQSVGLLAVGADAEATLWVGSPSGFFQSKDGGASFHLLEGLRPLELVDRLAVHPVTPEIAYVFGCCAAGELVYGLLKTADGGRTWRRLPYTGVLRDVEVIAIDPADPDIVFAGGDFEPHGSSCTAERSIDGGATWTCITPPAGYDLYSVAFDPRDPTLLYAAFAGGLYRSTDRGATWTRLPTSGAAASIGILATDPSQPDRLWAIAFGGLLRSDDGGRSWAAKTKGLPRSAGTRDFLLDPARPGRIWLALEVFEVGEVGKSTARVFRSDDAGEHWQELSNGLVPGTVVARLAADPRSADVLYAATAGQGLFRLDLAAP